jgi:hypothetical protein
MTTEHWQASAALAVDKALTPSDREVFMARLVGRWQGAQPADYIDQMYNADAELAHTEPWWETQGDDARAAVVKRTGLDKDQATVLLGLVLCAHLTVVRRPLTELWQPIDQVPLVEHAERAAMWLAGYAYATGRDPR